MALIEIPIVDGSSTTRTARFEQQTDGSMASRSVLEIDGTAVSAANSVGLPVNFISTSKGTDFSANQASAHVPNVGANFGTSGPYANYVLIATVPANTSRQLVDIENISGAQIVIVRDDGLASSGSAPSNASVFSLAGGAAAGQQGGSWTNATFKGRLQIYAASSTAMVTVMVD